MDIKKTNKDNEKKSKLELRKNVGNCPEEKPSLEKSNIIMMSIKTSNMEKQRKSSKKSLNSEISDQFVKGC